MKVETPDDRLAAAAQVQAGVFTRAQAFEAGFTRGQIDFRLANGLWTTLHPRVYCAKTAKDTREMRAVASLLHCGEPACFSHLTAARLLGIDAPKLAAETWLTIPHGRYASPRPGTIVKRTRNFPSPRRAYGYPVTPPARTVVDLAALLDTYQMRKVLYDVTCRGALTVQQILGVAEGMGGRTGVRSLRRVLQEFDPALESILEDDAARHFAAAGIALEPQVEVWDGGFLVARLDFADRRRKLAIEIDGFRWHEGRAAQTRDRRRDRELRRLGWTVLRFTTDDVRQRPQ